MTYDERQEIGVWMDIVKKNCERTLRSIELMQDELGGMRCSLGTSGEHGKSTQITNNEENTDTILEESKND